MKKTLSAFSFAAVVAAGAILPALGETGRLRHMADTYLQSDGTQIIDTGLLTTTNMRIVVEFEPVLTNGTRYLFGSAGNQAGQSLMKYGAYVQEGVIKFASGTGPDGGWNMGWHGSYKATHSRFKVIYDYTKQTAELWLGESLVWNTTSLVVPGFETNNCTVALFGNHNSPTSFVDRFGGKVYSFAIYEKGAPVRDMIPYGRGAVTGLLDRCSGKVYTNVRAGGHAFILGTDDAYIRSSRAKWSGQWLDTGYRANLQTKIEVDFALQDMWTLGQRIFGADTVDGLGISLYVASGYKFGWCCCDDPPVWHTTTVPLDGERRTVTIDVPNRTISFVTAEGVTEYVSSITTTCSRAATTSLRLFGGVYTNETGAVMHNCGASTKIYGVRIWDGATLVRDYRPRVVDNLEGLFDTVNGTLSIADRAAIWGSDHGKYRLVGGGDIECATSYGKLAANADSYLESFGGQGVDTGVMLSQKTRLEIDFAMDLVASTQHLFDDETHGLYCQLTGWNNGCKIALHSSTWPTINDGWAFPVRYQTVMDFKNASYKFVYPDGWAASNAFTLPSPFTATESLWLFSKRSGAPTNMRLYSFAIYEDDVLKHRYLPCVEKGVAGLWDSVDKRFLGNSRVADGSGFTFNGAGVDGGGMVFTEHPQGGRISREHTLTLTAFAPGAAGYQWLKNGEIIEGATGRTLEVTYGEGGTTDTYQCISHYALFGYGASDVAQIENVLSGTSVFLR